MFSRLEAFERNRGLISVREQEMLAGSLVVIPGCGGVGGLHTHTLARLGVGRFRLSDPDTFSLANINRQIGATVATVGQNKATVTAAMLRSINPEVSVEIVSEPVTAANVGAFIQGANLVVDGVDFFSVEARRQIFAAAWKAGVPALTAAPLGFSATLHVFRKGGMSFDEYFDLSDGQDSFEQIVKFFVGLAPKALHLPYMDLSSVDISTGRGPSSIVACQMAASVASAEAIRILLDRRPFMYAPEYLQVDCYRQMLKKGRLRRGNRNWIQQVKRRVVLKRLRALGLDRTLHKSVSPNQSIRTV
jgi:molybdopterin/thiamine biosynthesis adenylyltransferase